MATKRKVKRYDEGGDADSGEWARGENYGDDTTPDERVAMARAPAKLASDDEVRAAATPAEPPKQSFKEAFAAAKKGDTFEWNGKKYKKEFASDKKAAAPKSLNARVPVPEAVKPKAAKPKSTYETPFDRMNRENRESGRDFDSIVRRLTSRKEPLPTASDQAYKKGGMTASRRADGIAQRGKTRGKMR